MHLSRQLNCWSLRCSWSIACRRYSNYIFILGLTHGFNIMPKDNCKPIWEIFKFLDLVRLILETWQYMLYAPIPPVLLPKPPAQLRVWRELSMAASPWRPRWTRKMTETRQEHRQVPLVVRWRMMPNQLGQGGGKILTYWTLENLKKSLYWSRSIMPWRH